MHVLVEACAAVHSSMQALLRRGTSVIVGRGHALHASLRTPQAGFCSAVQTGMQALKRGGTFVLVGMGAEACNCFPSLTLVWKEADVKGCFRYTNTVRLSVPSHHHML